MKWRAPLERFMDLLIPEPNTGCWIWLGTVTHNQYGLFHDGSKMVTAHRWYWEQINGPIPPKLQMDHLCRTRQCVNPKHLRAVTARENTFAHNSLAPAKINAAKTHCKNGHLYSDDNTRIRLDRPRHRDCKLCHLVASRKHKAKLKQARAAL